MRISRKLAAAAISVAALGGLTACSATTGTSPPSQPTTAVVAPDAATQAPAVPNAVIHGSGNADYLIPSGIYDPVLLTGEVDLTNTGNTGAIVRVRMHWERTGFPDITQTRTVRVPWGTGTKVVQFNKNMGSFSGAGGNIIDEIQSYQDAHQDKPYGNFTLKIVDTFGAVH